LLTSPLDEKQLTPKLVLEGSVGEVLRRLPKLQATLTIQTTGPELEDEHQHLMRPPFLQNTLGNLQVIEGIK
jgi:hypothetical protein